MSELIQDKFELPVQEVSAACEALLFASGESMSLSKLSEILNTDKKLIEEALDKNVIRSSIVVNTEQM